MVDMIDHGDPEKWVDLNDEQTRCFLGLKGYYVRIENKIEEEALELAWADLKKETDRKTGKLNFPELQDAIWYRSETQ